MSGPHSRAYQPTVECRDRPEVRHVVGWIDGGTLPYWLRDALERQPETMEICETPYREYDLTITTLHTPAYGLGLSTRQFFGQSNVLIAHYVRPGQERPGVVYSRYLTNDKWLGSFYHSTDRSISRNLIDEGSFLGVQDGARAIALYTPRVARRQWRVRSAQNVASAKANVIWTMREAVDEIWVGPKKVSSVPADVPEGEVVVVVSGKAMTAVRPLTRTKLGDGAPLRLVEKGDDLVLEMYNYVGDSTTVAELDSLNAGRLQCGFYLEMADRSSYADGAAFARAVSEGAVSDETASPGGAEGGGRPWRVEYRRDERTLGIEADLAEWKLLRRWTEDGDLGFPMLESPIARQNRDGRVEVGGAALTCGAEAGWLFAPPGTGRYVAGYHGQKPAPLTLTVPGGSVDVEAMGVGTVVWDNGEVTVEAVDLQGTPEVAGGRLVR